MKITSVTARAVNIPFKTPYVWSVGGYLGITRVIVEVQTDEGITGYGEAPSWECQDDIMKHMAPKLIGKDPLDITACELACVPDMKVLIATDGILPRMSFGGIELALWDIRGKLWNMPLHTMLGGAVRKEVPFCEYFSSLLPKGNFKGISTEDEVVEFCLKRKEEFGSTYFEGKISSGNVRQDVSLVRRLRAALGDDAILRIDGNMAWSLPSAIELCRGIEDCNIRQFEDPMSTFWELEKLRKHTAIPFSTHNTDLALAVHLKVPDTFVINSTTLGGINRTVGFIRACEHMGINISFYSGDTGLATTVYMHFFAALDHVREPSQSLFRFMEFDVIEGGPLNPKNNMVTVPDAPGIGVRIDEENVKYGHELFKKDGPVDQYYNPQKPGQYIRVPLS